LPHAINARQHIIVPEPHDASSHLLKIGRPSFVLLAPFVVLTTVDLDNKLALDAGEVCKVASDGMLASEVVAS